MNMMKKNQIRPLAATLILATALTTQSNAGERWYTSATISTLSAVYSSSEQRNSQRSNSLLLTSDYLDRFGAALFYNASTIDFKAINGIDSDINQTTVAGRLHYRFFSDLLHGSLTPQITLHSISNDDATKLSDGITAIATKLTYINNRRTRSLDFEYTLSRYPNNSDLEIGQWSASAGLPLGRRSWLTITPTLIQSSNSDLTQGEARFNSIKLDWLHWFGPDAVLGLRQISVSLMGGERMYAVDNASFSVYNLADRQEGSLQLGAIWRPIHALDIATLLGSERYNNTTINNQYSQNYLYLSLTKHW